VFLIYLALFTLFLRRIRDGSFDPDIEAHAGPLHFTVARLQFRPGLLCFCYLLVHSVWRWVQLIVCLAYTACLSAPPDAFSLPTPIWTMSTASSYQPGLLGDHESVFLPPSKHFTILRLYLLIVFGPTSRLGRKMTTLFGISTLRK
jgi:hypothetical protein